MMFGSCLLALLMVIVWGFNFVVIQVAIDSVSPLLVVALRFILVSLPAVFFVPRPKVHFKWVVAYGLVMFALQFALLFLGMKAGMQAGLTALMTQLQVFMTLCCGIVFFGEKLYRLQIFGGCLAFSGIIFVACHVGGEVSGVGLVLVLLSTIVFAAGNVISKKVGQVNMPSLIIWSSLIAWPPLLALCFGIEGKERIIENMIHLSWRAIGAILYIAYLSTLFGYGTWSYLISRYSLSTIAPLTLLIPVVAIISSVIILQEPLESWKIEAGGLILAGVCLHFLGPRLAKKKSISK